jgi:hypothetical protein
MPAVQGVVRWRIVDLSSAPSRAGRERLRILKTFPACLAEIAEDKGVGPADV